MVCALPYHATGEFVRLVQIMPLDGTIWAFLRPMQKSGAPLPRPVLVRRCANDLVSARATQLLSGLRPPSCGPLNTFQPVQYRAPSDHACMTACVCCNYLQQPLRTLTSIASGS